MIYILILQEKKKKKDYDKLAEILEVRIQIFLF